VFLRFMMVNGWVLVEKRVTGPEILYTVGLIFVAQWVTVILSAIDISVGF
jgi:hypothetical protein